MTDPPVGTERGLDGGGAESVDATSSAEDRENASIDAVIRDVAAAASFAAHQMAEGRSVVYLDEDGAIVKCPAGGCDSGE